MAPVKKDKKQHQGRRSRTEATKEEDAIFVKEMQQCLHALERGEFQQDDGPIGLENLSPEFLNDILEYLTYPMVLQLRRVCKSLHKAVDYFVATRLRLDLLMNWTDFEEPVDDDYIKHVFSPPNRWDCLVTLHMRSGYVEMSSAGLETISKNAVNLRNISISCHDVNPADFRSFVKSYPSLVRFTYTATGGSISLPSLGTLFSNCPNLTHLALIISKSRFDFNENNIEMPRKMFLRKPENLTFLCLVAENETSIKLEPLLCKTFSSSLEVASLFAMPDVAMPKLKQVFINEFPAVKMKMNDQRLANYWNKFPKLQSINLWPRSDVNPHLEPKFDMKIFSMPNCPVTQLAVRQCVLGDLSFLTNFKCLDFKYTMGMWKHNIVSMLQKNESVAMLGLPDFPGPTNELLAFIGKTCKKLEFLNLSSCRSFNYKDILDFAQAHSKVCNPSKEVIIFAHRMFSIISLNFRQNCHISDSLLSSVAKPDYDLLRKQGVTLVTSWKIIGDNSPNVPLVDATVRNILPFTMAEVEWWIPQRFCEFVPYT